MILGCNKKEGVDYGETFAQVAKMAIVRTLLVVAAFQDWITIQMDVTNAFLHGDSDEEVYMSFPQDYTGMGSRTGGGDNTHSVVVSASSGSRLVRKLIKSFYGLNRRPCVGLVSSRVLSNMMVKFNQGLTIVC